MKNWTYYSTWEIHFHRNSGLLQVKGVVQKEPVKM